MSVLLSGWGLDPELRAAMLGDIATEAAQLPGRLAANGPAKPPLLAPGGAHEALRLLPASPAQEARIDWLRAGIGALALEGGEVIGLGGLAPEGAPDWRLSAADHAQLARALHEFAPQTGFALELAPAHFYGALARSLSRTRAESRPAPPRPGTPARADLQILAQEPVDHGFFAVDRLRVRVPGFDGALGPEILRTTWRGVDAAMALPYDPEADRVLFIEQFRFGPLMRGDPNPWKFEAPAGLIDPGESAEEAAAREMREEAHLSPKRLIPIWSGYGSPGYCADYFECFIGICEIPETAGWIGGAEGEAEDIRSHSFSFEAAMALLERGEIDVLPLAISLTCLAARRAQLRGPR